MYIQPLNMESNPNINQDKEKARLLNIRGILKNSKKESHVFSYSQYALHPWFCNACEVIIRWPSKHEQEETHRNNILHVTFDGVINKKNCADTVLQASLDAYTSAPGVGLEYILELKINKQHLEYYCVLCDKKANKGSVITHIFSNPHIKQYIERHFPKCHRIILSGNAKKGFPLLEIAKAVEKEYGRLKPSLVLKKLFDVNQLYYKELVIKGPHFSEKPNLTFEQLAKDLLASFKDNATNGLPEEPQIKLKPKLVSPPKQIVTQTDNSNTYEKWIHENISKETEAKRIEKVKEFRTLWGALEIDMQNILKKQKEKPDSHPLYTEEWYDFWRERSDVLKSVGVDIENYDFKPEWLSFWKQRMVDLHNQELLKCKEALRKRLDLPEETDLMLWAQGKIRLKVTNEDESKSRGKTTVWSRLGDREYEKIESTTKKATEASAIQKDRQSPHLKDEEVPKKRYRSNDESHDKTTKRSKDSINNSRSTRPTSKDRDKFRKRSRSRDNDKNDNKDKHTTSNLRRRSRSRSKPKDILKSKVTSSTRSSRRSRDRRSHSKDRLSTKESSNSRSKRSQSKEKFSRSEDLSRSRNRSKTRASKDSDKIGRHRSREKSPLRSKEVSKSNRKVSRSRSKEREQHRHHRSSSREITKSKSKTDGRSRDKSYNSRKRSHSRDDRRGKESDSENTNIIKRSSQRDNKEKETNRHKGQGHTSQVGDSLGQLVKPPAVTEDEDEEDVAVTVIDLLRILTAFEDFLGTMGPRIENLLTIAIALEKEEKGSSDNMLDYEPNCVVFETAKERLKGQIMAGLANEVQARAIKKAVQKITVLISIAGQRKRQIERLKPKTETLTLEQVLSSVMEVHGTHQMSNNILNNTSIPIKQETKEKVIIPTIYKTAGEIRPKSLASLMEPPPKENENLQELATLLKPLNNLDRASDSALTILLQNYKSLNTAQQRILMDYMSRLALYNRKRFETFKNYIDDIRKNDTTLPKERQAPLSSILAGLINSQDSQKNPKDRMFPMSSKANVMSISTQRREKEMHTSGKPMDFVDLDINFFGHK